jgi:hypothetical protein
MPLRFVALMLCLLPAAVASAQDSERLERMLADAWGRTPSEGAYRELMHLDASRGRTIDPDWAKKVGELLGPEYRLRHGPHFSLLTNVEDAQADEQLKIMESAYRSFYLETTRLGVRPLPPQRRLLCVLTARESEFRDFMKRFEGLDVAWSSGMYSWRTNRTVFYHESDRDVFREARGRVADLAARVARLREEMEAKSPSDTKARVRLQEELRKATWQHSALERRVADVAGQATGGKTRHEVTHQLLFNSGVQRRGRDYPFWLSEGLACLFEDAAGAGPTKVNEYRLERYRRLEKDGKLQSIPDLLSNRPAGDDALAQVVGDYAQSWALCHLLWNRYPAGMRDYLQELQDADRVRDWHAMFARHFTDDYRTLELELKDYVERLK